MASLVNRFRQASWKRRIAWMAGGSLAFLLVIQLVPYGRGHNNPPVTSSPVFANVKTEELFKSSCGDCHSNLTEWRWYSNIAPVSWLVQSDVDGARKIMNLSEWGNPQPEIGEVQDVISSGEMPPLKYTVLHGGAKLSGSEKQALVDGLTATWATDPPGGVR